MQSAQCRAELAGIGGQVEIVLEAFIGAEGEDDQRRVQAGGLCGDDRGVPTGNHVDLRADTTEVGPGDAGTGTLRRP